MKKRKFDSKRLRKVIFILSLLCLAAALFFHFKYKTEPVNCVPYGNDEVCLGFPKIKLYIKLKKIFLLIAALIPIGSVLIHWLFNYLFPRKGEE